MDDDDYNPIQGETSIDAEKRLAPLLRQKSVCRAWSETSIDAEKRLARWRETTFDRRRRWNFHRCWKAFSTPVERVAVCLTSCETSIDAEKRLALESELNQLG